MSNQSRLLHQLQELLREFVINGIRHAAIGGLAVNVHGYSRATRDVDFLVPVEDEGALHTLMQHLDYEVIDRREDLASYVRGDDRADFLYAHREVSRKLLAGASMVEFEGVRLPVVSAEGLLGFKIQAFDDDPRRLQDLVDMLELVRARGQSLNWDEIRGYFALFGREDLFNELKRAADATRD